jgi:hypothetical protein
VKSHNLGTKTRALATCTKAISGKKKRPNVAKI